MQMWCSGALATHARIQRILEMNAPHYAMDMNTHESIVDHMPIRNSSHWEILVQLICAMSLAAAPGPAQSKTKNMETISFIWPMVRPVCAE